jgi:alpha-tubulin suppressor-like RCC1 family protein
MSAEIASARRRRRRRGFGRRLRAGKNGTVWAWGDDSLGELGNGVVREDEAMPVQVKGLSHVVAIAAGSCSGYALLEDGAV